MYWEEIHGMFNFDNIYNDAITQFNDAVFVEIGTWKGKSAIYMAEKIKDSGKNIKFYTVDLFEYVQGYESFTNDGESLSDSFLDEVMANVSPIKDYINIIKGRSYEIADQFEDKSIDFIFIDGDHSYLGVKKDLEAWYPKIKLDRIIAGHDYSERSCGVKKAVDEFFAKNKISINRSSWIFNTINNNF